MDRFPVSKSLFVDFDAAGNRHRGGLFECLVLGQREKQYESIRIGGIGNDKLFFDRHALFAKRHNMTLIIGFIAGIILGLIYFGGLWFTVRWITKVRQPALLVVGSFAVRSAIVLLGFYQVLGGSSGQLIACLVGFFATRIVLTRVLRPEVSNSNAAAATEGLSKGSPISAADARTTAAVTHVHQMS
jgi:F1F0 ATPase subunit 2